MDNKQCMMDSCMYVWMSVCIYKGMGVYMYGCMDVRMYVCLSVCMQCPHACVHARVHACMHVCMYAHTYVRAYECMSVSVALAHGPQGMAARAPPGRADPLLFQAGAPGGSQGSRVGGMGCDGGDRYREKRTLPKWRGSRGNGRCLAKGSRQVEGHRKMCDDC